MLRCQFLCHVLKAIFFIKISLKLSYFCKKMQNFLAPGALPPDPLASGGWGLSPRPPKQPSHREFLATRLNLVRIKYALHNAQLYKWFSSGFRLWSGRSKVQITARSNRRQSCQRFATAATFFRKEPYCLGPMTRRWALQTHYTLRRNRASVTKGFI